MAQQFCRILHPKGNLVTVSSAKHTELLIKDVLTPYDCWCWIGLHAKRKSLNRADYVWYSGERVAYNNWGRKVRWADPYVIPDDYNGGQGECVAAVSPTSGNVYPGGVWDDVDCSPQYPFCIVCEAPK